MDPSQPVSYNSAPSGGRKFNLLTIILVVLLIASLVLGIWALSQMQHYKSNSNQITAAAVAAAEKDQAAKLQAQFDEQSKAPNKTFVGSATYGSITFEYPKTWSGYVDTTGQSEPINGYFFPGVVPSPQSKTAFALRLELVSTDYSQILQQFQSQTKAGTVVAKAYLPPKMNGVANAQPGTLLSGAINGQDQTQHGTLLIIKVRDKTLEISTQSNDYLNDFNNIILASLTFSP